MFRRAPFAYQVTILCLGWLLLNLPILAGRYVLPWDAMDEFYPSVYFNVHSLRQGLAPWWNPELYSGYPQIADPQGMLFSPLLMAWMLLREAPGATWFCWAVLLHLLVGGIATLALLRRSSANAFGALIAATVYMAGGVAASRLEHVPIVLCYGYVPVVLLAIRYFLAYPGLWRAVLLGLAWGAMLTQLVQLTYLASIMLAAYAIAAIVTHWRSYDVSSRRRCATGMVLACLTTLALGLPQLLLTLSYVSLSNRAAMPLSDAASASLDASALLTLVNPNAWHALLGTYSGSGDRVEAFLYIGAIPLLLIPIGIKRAWKLSQQRRQLLFFGAVTFISLFYMFGIHTPFYGWLYQWMPGIKLFRRPSDAAYLVNLSLAIFTGLAASHLQLSSRKTITTLLFIAACWLALASLPMRDADQHWKASTLLASICAMAGCLMLILRQKTRQASTRLAAFWILFVLVCDYRSFNLNGTFNQERDPSRRFVRNPAVLFLAQQQAKEDKGFPARIEPLYGNVDWDNNVVLKGFFSTQGYNPLRYGLYDTWSGARADGMQARIATAFNPSPDSRMNDLLGVGYVIRSVPQQSRRITLAGYRKIYADAHTEIWRNDHAYARILNPSHAVLLPLNTPPPVQDFLTNDFRTSFWLTPRDAIDQQQAKLATTQCSGQVQAFSSIKSTPTNLLLETSSPQSGWLVLGELDFPGWEAEIDGLPLAIHRANGMFRSACIPAGTHNIAFHFSPWLMVADWYRRSI